MPDINTVIDTVIAMILASRSISDERKQEILNMLNDKNISDDDLTKILSDLCDAESGLAQEEVANLEKILKENDEIMEQEEATVAPEETKIMEDLARDEESLYQEVIEKSKDLNKQADQIEEEIEEDENAQNVADIKAKLLNK